MIAIYLIISFIVLVCLGAGINDCDEPQLSYLTGLLGGVVFVWLGQYFGVL